MTALFYHCPYQYPICLFLTIRYFNDFKLVNQNISQCFIYASNAHDSPLFPYPQLLDDTSAIAEQKHTRSKQESRYKHHLILSSDKPFMTADVSYCRNLSYPNVGSPFSYIIPGTTIVSFPERSDGNLRRDPMSF